MTKAQLYENFSNNIELERMRLGLTQQKMADALEISLSKYKILITNPFEANVDIYLAHKVYKLTGKTVREMCNDDLPELEMLQAFRELSDHRREAIRYLIEVESQLPSDSGVIADSSDVITCFVPTGNMEDGMTLDSNNLESVNIANYRHKCREHIDFAVKITSNHLHPVYNLGDVLLVSRRAPRDGDVGIFIFKDTRQIYIREFKQTSPCQLRPINGLGEIIYVDSSVKADMDKWIKFGTVITAMR